jgi:endoglucanase
LIAVSLLPFAGTLVKASEKPTTATFNQGVNICHWLSQCFDHPYGGDWFTEKDVQWIADQGFDHIRYPIDARLWLKADGTLDPAKIKPFEDAIVWTRKRHLGIILDVHFLPGADFNDGGDGRAFVDPVMQEKAVQIWRDIAARFAKEPNDVRFEIINEPVAPENKLLNGLNKKALAAIRETNPTRIVYITSNRWSIFSTLEDLDVPSDPNIAITVHFYEPAVFTHQNAPWVFTRPGAAPIHFPGKVPDLTPYFNPGDGRLNESGKTYTVEKDIDEAFAGLAKWIKAHAAGREILLGEFGVYKAADDASMRNWIKGVLAACKRHNIAWNYWGYRSDEFGVVGWDGQPRAVLNVLKEELPKK